MFLVLFLVLVSIALHRDPLESLLFAVALAVGVVPEFMPMVTSITLATGAVRMARRHVIVKHLAAIHNFGSIDVLCSDKTGTLTRGEMRLDDGDGCVGHAEPLVLASSAGVAAHLADRRFGIRSTTRFSRDVRAGRRWTKVDEIPFDFERRRTSVVVARDHDGHSSSKGAPEHVLAACTTCCEATDVPAR